jgi:hypothetical protein
MVHTMVCVCIHLYIQGDKKVSVHLMITAQKKKKTQKYFEQFQSLTMIMWLELGIIDGVSVNLVSINVWRLAGDTVNITCNFLYCNHQGHGDVLITVYIQSRSKISE